MNTQITGNNMEVTAALRELTEKKLKKLSSHIDSITSIHITFNVDNLSQIAKAQVAIPGKTIHASAESEDMYKTIDLLIKKLILQIDKHKDKTTNH